MKINKKRPGLAHFFKKSSFVNEKLEQANRSRNKSGVKNVISFLDPKNHKEISF